MTKRNRIFTRLDECVNPIYHKEWGYPVTVQDSITFCFEKIVEAAQKKICKYNQAFIVFQKKQMRPDIMQLIQSMCYFDNMNIQVVIDDVDDEVEYEKRAIPVKFVSFTPHRPQYAIPYCWNDDELDWTWKDVLYYGPPSGASSSTSVWPPLEYKIKAQEELVQKLERRAKQ